MLNHRTKAKFKAFALFVGVVFSFLNFPTQSFAVTAQETYSKAKVNKFFRDKEEGWYWYQDPETGELRKLEEVPPPVSRIPTTKPTPSDEEYAKDHPFSAQWVRVMLPRYMDIAWNDPSPKNVQAYFLVQKFAMDRAQDFAQTARKVVLGNLMLDGSVNRPLASYGVKDANAATVKARDALLKKLCSQIGIFYFFKSTCPHCETFAPIILMAEKTLGFNVIAVSVDGGELKSVQFAKTYKDAGHAKRLGVESVPSTFLMNSKGEFDLIAASPVSLDQLKERILIAAERQGWITKAEADKTRYIINPETKHDFSKELPALLQASKTGDVGALMGFDKEKLKKIKSMTDEDRKSLQEADGFISPDNLISILNKTGKTSAFPYAGKLNTKELKELQNGLEDR